MPLGDDKTKSILFSSKHNLKLVEEDIRYKEIKIKEHKHLNYLECVLDETMALRVIEKPTLDWSFFIEKIGF